MTVLIAIILSAVSFAASYALGGFIERKIRKRREREYEELKESGSSFTTAGTVPSLPKSSRRKYKIGRVTNLADQENKRLMTLLVSDQDSWMSTELGSQSLVGKYVKSSDGCHLLVMSDTIGISQDGTKIGHWLSVIGRGIDGGVEEVFVECNVPTEIGETPPTAFIDNVEYFCKNQCPMDCDGCKLAIYGLRKNRRTKKS